MKSGYAKIFLLLTSVAVGLFVFIPLASAAVHDMAGWAWSENIGWVSFSSLNCDADSNGFSDGNGGCPSIATPLPSYGMRIDFSTYELSGYAWSENIGWITFNKSDAGTPPAAPYNGTETYMAKYNQGTGLFEGWARATSCQDAACDANSQWGWIKLSGTAADGSPYAVRSTGANGELAGFAWGGDVIGWISFNAQNTGAAYDYKVRVFNISPTASNLTSFFSDRCGAPFEPRLSFQYQDAEGDPLAQYTIAVYDSASALIDTTPAVVNSFSSVPITIDYTYDGRVKLNYNQTYYYKITIQDAPSLSFFGAGAAVTSGPSPVMKTDQHQRPQFVNSPKINWSPSAPFAGDMITLTALSTVYVIGQSGFNASTPAISANASYNWTIATSTTSTFSSTLLFPQVSYSSSGNFDVAVTVTDKSGNTCYNGSSVSESCFCEAKSLTSSGGGVKVSKPRPQFREIKP